MDNKNKRLRHSLIVAMTIFIVSCFSLLLLKDLTLQSAIMLVAVPGGFYLLSTFVPRKFFVDGLLLALVNFLCCLGIIVLYRMNPGYGINQAINYLAGYLAMILCMLAVRYIEAFKPLRVPFVVVCIVVMLAPVLIGKERNGAKAWLFFGGLSVQPSELVKVGLVLVNGYLLSKRKLIASIAFSAMMLVLLLLQKDMGTALLYYGVALVMMYVATGSESFLLAGIAGATGAVVIGYQLLKRIGFAHLARRVTAWLSPWATYQDEGYQTVQSLLAIVNGGLFGLGLGAGNASNIPVREADSIFPFIVNEFGMIFGICLIIFYILIFVRGIAIAVHARQKFHSLIALGCSMFIGFQTFVIIGGNINLIPITGVTLPYISYGGTSLLSSLCIIGVLQGVEWVNRTQMAHDAQMATIGGQE